MPGGAPLVSGARLVSPHEHACPPSIPRSACPLWIALLAFAVAVAGGLGRAAETVERVPNDKCWNCHGLGHNEN